MPIVLGLDVASYKTGVAHGTVGEKPFALTWTLGDADSTRRERLAKLVRYLSDLLKVVKPDLVAIEAPLNLQAAAKRREDTALALIGGAIVAETICHMRGVRRVEMCNVLKVRAHFTGQRTYSDSYDPVAKKKITSRENAKSATRNMCAMRGWSVSNDDEADAAALFSYGSTMLDRRLAALATPLFGTSK